jgi:hypothetical protein
MKTVKTIKPVKPDFFTDVTGFTGVAELLCLSSDYPLKI